MRISLDNIERVFKWISVGLAIIFLYQLVKKLVGGSWSHSELLLAIGSIHISLTVGLIVIGTKMYDGLKVLKQRVGILEQNMQRSIENDIEFRLRFERVEKDSDSMKKDIKQIKNILIKKAA